MTVWQHAEHLDAIVHFAGIYMLDSLVEMDDDAFRLILDVNLRGVFLINKTFLPLLGDGGRILITTSELAPLDPLLQNNGSDQTQQHGAPPFFISMPY